MIEYVMPDPRIQNTIMLLLRKESAVPAKPTNTTVTRMTH